jgi:[ribosomal protein S5]-alanine N-acetyltransferase
MFKLDMPTQILTERLSLQKLRYEEAEEIFYGYASKPEATKFMSWPTHQSLEDTESFLRYAAHGWENGTDYSYAIRLRHSGRLIGSFGIMNEFGRLQFGYILSPTQWGRGYATEVCKTMLSVLQKQTGIYSIKTFIDVENTASANVLRKSGMIEEGVVPNDFTFVNQGNRVKDCLHFTFPLST